MQVKPAQKPWIAFRLPRNSQRVAAALLLVILAATAVGVSLVAHRALTSVPAGPATTVAPDKMVSPTIGWASGPGHAVLRTTDGGAHWTEMHPIPSPGFETSFYFLDATHAWITDTPGSEASGWCCGGPGNLLAPSTAYQLRTFRTADGGRTWQQGTPVSAQTLPGFYGGLGPALFFLDPVHGWLLLRATNAIYSSSDGGMHWQLTSSDPAGTAPDCSMDQMSFASPGTGWLTTSCGTENLWVTHDGGVTWRIQTLPFKTPDVVGLDVPVFFDAMHGELLVDLGPASNPTRLLLVTSDGGSTWSTRSVPGDSQLSVDFVDASHGWVVAGHESDLSNGPVWDSLALYYTDDGGRTWAAMQTNLVIQADKGLVTSLFFVDQKNGFALRAPSCFGQLGGLCTQGPSEFLKTTDGGHTWSVVWQR